MADLYISRNTKIDVAKKMVLNAISMYNNGAINHQYRLSPSQYKTYVGKLLITLSKAEAVQGNFNEVIGYTSAALNIINGTNIEGNLLPNILQLRAQAYKHLNNFNLAMEDYKALFKAGNKQAIDSMVVIFPDIPHIQKNFPDFLASLKPSTPQPQFNHLTTAPEFSGIDLKGDTVSSSSLKGKMIVLNYWGTGCGPCIAEMPKLNELVDQNKERKDLVFLAATLDEKERLINFLKTKKFDYRVFIVTENFIKEYAIDALPVHIIIGKNGEIISRSVGARPDIKEYLQGIIDTEK